MYLLGDLAYTTLPFISENVDGWSGEELIGNNENGGVRIVRPMDNFSTVDIDFQIKPVAVGNVDGSGETKILGYNDDGCFAVSLTSDSALYKSMGECEPGRGYIDWLTAADVFNNDGVVELLGANHGYNYDGLFIYFLGKFSKSPNSEGSQFSIYAPQVYSKYRN